VGQSARHFIVRIKIGKVNYRVVSGWSIAHYGIKEGMEINVELLEEVESQKQNKNANVNQRYLNNILGLKQAEMEEISEEKEAENEVEDYSDS
jgi:hypothetical protein